MKLIICEKPSVAASISSVLNAKKREGGFFSGGDYLVSWCYGHLVELAPPDAYDEKYAKWRTADLPIIPKAWKYTVPKDKTKQLKILAGLIARTDVDEVVNACDAGREGELIFRLVYSQCGSEKPIKRLWISSMEDSAIRDGFAALKGGAEYERLYASALCRSQADWIVGLNATRLYSTLYNVTLSVGRVQSPTLAMLVKREADIAAFVKEPFYTVELDCGGFKAVSNRFKDETAAEVLQIACDGKTATVTKVERQKKTTAPPKLYDLTTLQREANRLFGFTAQETLIYAQSLYEKKLITYPRTDSRFLTSDMAEGLDDFILRSAEKSSLPAVYRSAYVEPLINSKKVTDHHAIIPTKAYLDTDLSALSSGERDTLHLIAVRLYEASAPRHVYEAITVTVECRHNPFTAKGKRIIENGWKAVEQEFRAMLKAIPDDEDGEDNSVMPNVSEGMRFEKVPASLREGFTAPPKHYTEDTLLSAMENAGAEDMPNSTKVSAASGGGSEPEYERKGLGTPATRAGVIEKIIKMGYVERKKKNLIPTEKGINLITVLPYKLTSPKLTAEWEHMLKEIERGETTAEMFLTGITAMTTELIKNNAILTPGNADLFIKYVREPQGEVIGVCPRCGKPVREGGGIGFFCDNNSCGFKLWRDTKFFTGKKKELTKAIAAELLNNGRAAVTGLYSEKTGRTYDAVIVLDDTGDKYVNFKLEFAPKEKRKRE